MGIEEVILRLARAVESQGQASAVSEIIRQRDEALNNLSNMTRDRDWYTTAYRNRGEDLSRMERSLASLRGVITRMKNAKAKEAL